MPERGQAAKAWHRLAAVTQRLTLLMASPTIAPDWELRSVRSACDDSGRATLKCDLVRRGDAARRSVIVSIDVSLEFSEVRLADDLSTMIEEIAATAERTVTSIVIDAVALEALGDPRHRPNG